MEEVTEVSISRVWAASPALAVPLAGPVTGPTSGGAINQIPGVDLRLR